MYFTSGPPRTYGLPKEEVEKCTTEGVSLVQHPSLPILARVTRAHVALWGAPTSTGTVTHVPLALVRRKSKTESLEVEEELQGLIPDQGGAYIRQVSATWTTDNRLAVVDTGSKVLELYSFQGLDLMDATSDSNSLVVSGSLDEAFRLNQDESVQARQDVAVCMSGYPGSSYLFIGMLSGTICVVEVPSQAPTSWFSPPPTSLWKIDVTPHLSLEDGSIPSCYGLTCAPTDMSSFALVACFEGGKCFIMLVSPLLKAIDQLLSLVNTEKDESSSCYGRCTSLSLDSSGRQLALGWSDGGVSLFSLVLSSQEDDAKALTLEPVRELTLTPWGYTSIDVGCVTCISWASDSKALAIGYEHRGVCVFSLDGCRLFSSLPLQQQDKSSKEVASEGVIDLLWTQQNSFLVLVSRGESVERLKLLQGQDTSPLYSILQASVDKQDDGLCLSLAGSADRPGAWVRSENPFTRTSTGDIGPAEACRLIHKGDLLVGIQSSEGDMDLTSSSFHDVIQHLKRLPNEKVLLSLLRIDWDTIIPLIMKAFASSSLDDSLLTEEVRLREYALRMQLQHGDCDGQRPSVLDADRRSKFDAWEALENTPHDVVQHRYIKLYLSLFPWTDPRTVLSSLSSHSKMQTVHMRRPPPLSFSSLSLIYHSSLSTSRLAFLEHSSVRLLAPRTVDSPSSMSSYVSYTVPPTYASSCTPMRLATVSNDTKHVAVAGQRGFCLLNTTRGKWRLFGNVNEEQDMKVSALAWVTDDAILAAFSLDSEEHAKLHLQLFPRDHLDDQSSFLHLVLPTSESASSLHVAQNHVYLVTSFHLWSFYLVSSGSLLADNLFFALDLKRQVQLPFAASALQDIIYLPRYQHVEHPDLETLQMQKHREQVDRQNVSISKGWLSSIMGYVVGTDTPDAYAPANVLPRLALLTSAHQLLVFDPETSSTQLVANDVSSLTCYHASRDWPTPCRLQVGVYGASGMRMWLPMLDGLTSHETFVSYHDPIRARTWEQQVSPENLLTQYDLPADLVLPLDFSFLHDSAVDPMLRFDLDVKVLDVHATFGLLVGVSQDAYTPSGMSSPCYDIFTRVQPFCHTLLTFLAACCHHFAPLALECIRKDLPLACATQEMFLHAMLELRHDDKCSDHVLRQAIQLLQPPCPPFCPPSEMQSPSDDQIADYCQVVAHVARKSEPSRLDLLFPAAGDPLELLSVARNLKQLRTAANFLLILDASSVVESSSSHENRAFRAACAAEIVAHCLEQDEWGLAVHVLRVARDWDRAHAYDPDIRSIDEHLGRLTWHDLTRGRFDRVVKSVRELGARLPTNMSRDELGLVDADEANLARHQLEAVFIDGDDKQGLRTLFYAVQDAHYEPWARLVEEVMLEHGVKK